MENVTKTRMSNHLKHFFHVVSNVRPIVWICLYVALMPLFALVYMWLPDTQFRIPDGAGTDYGSWLYYSIVTITTLGFGDYTPAHGWAQAVTAIEVMCGLVILGFFLNAVGSMKSEIDVESEKEKQRLLHADGEKAKLLKSIPAVMHVLNQFMAYCYAVTTPHANRTDASEFNPDFKFSDMADLYKPSGLSDDFSSMPTVERFMKCASRTSLFIDSMQSRIDMTLWPDLLEDCFTFVANYQIFSSGDVFSSSVHGVLNSPDGQSEKELSEKISSWKEGDGKGEMAPLFELYNFIKENGLLARKIETALTTIASEQPAQ